MDEKEREQKKPISKEKKKSYPRYNTIPIEYCETRLLYLVCISSVNRRFLFLALGADRDIVILFVSEDVS